MSSKKDLFKNQTDPLPCEEINAEKLVRKQKRTAPGRM
ncbi:hypothetical protein SNOG_09601 [Parastagonospora nodorum SN15]|uniref:Uncharacterized protein n=1 Tax=Phaeosphaeria nodorum (strain SN15 / ATCC MYA-4574 / FGSC 10173) TaxID=321614 RepID=Q0UF63_PHANO|nr:hypothetical protein SNOG_09601 [Parastagonospora nodorum SN15]EAT82866.1 hypothetical protein SNOG_09601 [Parastagonospora nodorum SN15]